jgi:hypothetical protein
MESSRPHVDSSLTIAALTARVRAEFDESPGMRLTEPQVRRLLNLDPVACSAILAALCDNGILVRDHTGHYRRA